MIDICDAARQLNDNPIADDPPVESVYRRAASLRRGVLMRRSAAAIVALLAIAIGLTTIHTSTNRLRVVTGPPNTATGAITKTLGADYDPYVSTGFHLAAGGGSVFWTHLDQAAQRFRSHKPSLDIGTTRTVSEGSIDVPSPRRQVPPGPY
jgi:hypothetical protein